MVAKSGELVWFLGRNDCTALSVLEVETHTVPIPLQLLQISVNTALRIKGTPTFRRIQQYRDAGYAMCKDRLSPLQRIEL
jgi:hypothetical protein